MKNKFAILALAGVVFAAPLGAAPLAGNGVERLSYSWKLKGGLSWLAKLAFPASGKGTLETREANTVSSKLTINGSDSKSYYLYESSMLPEGAKTLTSRNAYAYKDNARDERVAFDYASNTAKIQRTTDNGTETKLHSLDSTTPQDVLTSIYYLRQHADEIHMPKRAEIYSGAKAYDVVFKPLQPTTMKVGNRDVRVRPFTIEPYGDEAKRFPGEVRVWLSDDAKRTPVRIDIQQKFGTVNMNLQE